VLQQLDLTQRALGEDLLAEYIGDLLDGHAFAGLVVGCCTAGTHYQRFGGAMSGCDRVLPDDAVRALTKLLGHVVSLVDDEFLVEDLRVVSPWRHAASPRL
jgi:hypothetical protein